MEIIIKINRNNYSIILIKISYIRKIKNNITIFNE
jgi:hypothetical protein